MRRGFLNPDLYDEEDLYTDLDDDDLYYQIIFSDFPAKKFHEMAETTSLPEQNFLKQTIPAVIRLETYDWVMANYEKSEFPYRSDRSHMIWLAKQQGFTVGEFNWCIQNTSRTCTCNIGSYIRQFETLGTTPSPGLARTFAWIQKHGSESWKETFLFSAAREFWTADPYYSGDEGYRLCFFIELTFEELLFLNTLIKWGERTGKWNGYIRLEKNVASGLYDTDVSASGHLEITLEREVKIPMKYIERVHWENNWSEEKTFQKGKLLHICVPKKFRRDVTQMGFTEEQVSEILEKYHKI